MDVTLPSRLLAEQHHTIDTGIKGILDGNGQLPALAEALALLRLHLYAEEQILFPALSRTNVVMAIIAMKREHGQMWPHIVALTAGGHAQSPSPQLHDHCDKLFKLLEVHNPKEEQIIYTAADKFAATYDDTVLVHALHTAQAPAGWVCEKAPR